MLTHITSVHGEAQDGSPLLVLLHGRGSNEQDLQGLKSVLPEGLIVCTPRAPFEAAQWGYGPGWAWYRYIAEDRIDGETLETSLSELDDFFEALPAELPFVPGPLILGGFSQGGTTSVAWALTRPDRVAGVVNLSGFVVADPQLPVQQAAGLHVFWSHGLSDPNIPHELARRGRGTLREAGARITEFDHPGGHNVTPEGMRSLGGWLKDLEAREGA
ncbi:MAG: alpha/beta fold hydrolase [Gemmatimonadota bacterium]